MHPVLDSIEQQNLLTQNSWCHLMKEIKCLVIEDSDLETLSDGYRFTNIKESLVSKASYCDLILYKGRLVKNRYGSIDGTPNVKVRGCALLRSPA